MKRHKFKTPEAQLEKILEDATVDCYGDSEQFMGVVVALEDNLPFPFQAEVIGEIIEVIGIDENNSALGRGVIATVRKSGKEYQVSLSEIQVAKNFKGRKWLELYDYFIKGFG